MQAEASTIKIMHGPINIREFYALTDVVVGFVYNFPLKLTTQ